MLKKKRTVAILLATLALLSIAAVTVAQTLMPALTTEGPEPTTDIALEADTEPQPVVVDGVYHEPTSGLSMRVLSGWNSVETNPSVLRSPDEEGLVNYADTRGMAITVQSHSCENRASLTAWLKKQDLERYLVGAPQAETVAGYPAVFYEAGWDSLGQAVGVFIRVDDKVIQIDCFYPVAIAGAKEGCRGALLKQLETLAVEP